MKSALRALLIACTPISPTDLSSIGSFMHRHGLPTDILCRSRVASEPGNRYAVILSAVQGSDLHLFWTNAAKAGGLSTHLGDWQQIFCSLAQECEEVFIWPRDRVRLQSRIHNLTGSVLEEVDGPARIDQFCSEVGLIGRSPAFCEALRLVCRLARYDVPVMLEGETGTGKELFARALHYLSPRSARPFIPINCGALPDSLLESELFGHSRGAFTDARAELRGLIAQAEGGTLFFDEVHSLSAKGQATLLRFFQDHVYRPLGSEVVHRADVRIVTATNCPLGREVDEGHFREDLLYRLKVAPIRVPALRERPEDIPLLAESIMTRLTAQFECGPRRFDDAAFLWLASQPWRGNVRELENYLCRLFLLSDDEVIRIRDEADGADAVLDWRETVPSFKEARDHALREFEGRYLRMVLRMTNGNVTHAARRAGKERRVFGRLLKRHRIDRREFG
jgi:two-component system response regulator GlrR